MPLRDSSARHSRGQPPANLLQGVDNADNGCPRARLSDEISGLNMDGAARYRLGRIIDTGPVRIKLKENQMKSTPSRELDGRGHSFLKQAPQAGDRMAFPIQKFHDTCV